MQVMTLMEVFKALTDVVLSGFAGLGLWALSPVVTTCFAELRGLEALAGSRSNRKPVSAWKRVTPRP